MNVRTDQRPGAWEQLSQQDRDELQYADAQYDAFARGNTIEGWQRIGAAYNTLQARAMAAAGTNKPVGKRYNQDWAELLMHLPHLEKCDSTTRTHAMWLANEWEAVFGWFQTLAVNERIKLGHPTAVRRRYDRAHNPPKGGGEMKPNARLAIQDQFIQARATIDRQAEEIAELRKGSVGAMSLHTARARRDLVDRLADANPVSTLALFVKDLQERMKADERQDQIEARVKRRKAKA
jgi:hypothetical protein